MESEVSESQDSVVEIVVEGKSDRVFFNAIANRLFGQDIESLGYEIVVAGKDRDVIKVAASLATKTGKEVIVARDYDEKSLKDIVKSVITTMKGMGFKAEIVSENTIKISDTESTIRVQPLGLVGDEFLASIGVKTHEMEDYILRLMEIDENVKNWFGIDLQEIARNAKKAGLSFNLSKSRGLVELSAFTKEMSSEEFIREVINRASVYNVKLAIGDLMTIFTRLQKRMS